MKGWRTLIFGIIVAVLGAVEAFDWASVVPQEFTGIVLLVVGMIITWLRKITDTSLGQSKVAKLIGKRPTDRE